MRKRDEMKLRREQQRGSKGISESGVLAKVRWYHIRSDRREIELRKSESPRSINGHTATKTVTWPVLSPPGGVIALPADAAN